MPPKSLTAVSIKERGNIAFKGGRIEEAAKLYRLAELKDSNDRTYPSNLSAALYELGDYQGCFEAICRATHLSIQTDVPFLLRLSMRLAKCLTQGAQNGTISDEAIMVEFEVIEKLKGLASASESVGVTKELQSMWGEWDLVLGEAAGDRLECKRSAQLDLARMDFKRQQLESLMDYFHTGTDEIMSMAHGWGSPEAVPLKLTSYSDEQLSNINFLLGGVGDGRHLLGTIIGLKNPYRSLSKSQRAVARFHLTALDIHPTTIARNLVFLFLINELVDGQTITPEMRAEVTATYMYTFVGVVMPDYCHKRLMAILDDLRDRLLENPPRLPSWISVPTNSIPLVLGSINYWIDTAKTTETKRVLELHEFPDPSAPTPPATGMGIPDLMFPHPGNLAGYSNKLLRELSLAGLEAMAGQQLAQTGLVPAYIPPGQARQYFKRHKPEVVEVMIERMKASFPSANIDIEIKWYGMTKTVSIPRELEAKHPVLKQLSAALRQGKEIPRTLINKAQREIETTWKPNITLYSERDQLHPGAHKGYPITTFNFPVIIHNLRQFDPLKCASNGRLGGRSDNIQATYDWTSRMLCTAAEALVAPSGGVKVELICAELFSELQLMRNREDHHRPKEFPRSFLRIWMSNIPDFTHGVINAVTQVLPNLQMDNEESALAMRCGMNIPAWANDEEFIYTYTFLRSKDVPRFLGCRIITKTPAFGALSLGRLKTEYPLPLSKLATRKELAHWLSTQLINILVPGAVRDPGPGRVRFANNPVAFLRLLLYLHLIGYPSHWLSEFLQSVLWNNLVTEAVGAKELPIPVTHAIIFLDARKVDLAPWVPEFEMLLAITKVGLPFHVRLPADFASKSEEIGTYETNFHWSSSGRSLSPLFAPNDHAAMLVFWRSSSIRYSKDVSGLIKGSIDEKGRATPRNDLVVLNCLEGLGDGKVRWKLAKKRVEGMKREGDWEMAIFRSDSCLIVSVEVPSSEWRDLSP